MAKITLETRINDCIEMDVNCARVFFENGMFCIGCPSAAFESIVDASAVHGIDANKLVDDLNKYFEENPVKE